MSTSAINSGNLQPPALPDKYFCDYVREYVLTTDGAADLFSVIKTGAKYLKGLPLSSDQAKVVDGIIATASDGWDLMVWPDVIAESHRIYKNVDSLVQAYYLPVSNADRDRRVSAAAYDVFLQSIEFLNAYSEAAMFIHNKQWVNLGGGACFSNWMYNVTSLASDIASIDKQIGLLYQYQNEYSDAKTEDQQASIWQKIQLSIVKLIRDVADVAMCVIAILSLIFGALIQGLFFLPALALGLNTIYLATKIFAYFYEKMAIEARPAPSVILAQVV